jgi:hypothetical protein
MSTLAIITTHTRTVTTSSYDILDLIKMLIPVMLFFAGLGFNRILENWKENKRLSEIKAYFYLLIDYLATAIEAEQKALMNEARVLKVFKSSKISIDDVPMFKTEHIKRINQADLFKIFIHKTEGDSGNNIKHYIQIQSVLDFIDAIKPNIDAQSKEIVEFAKTNSKEWNVNMKAILLFYNERKARMISDGEDVDNDDLVKTMEPLLAGIKGKVVELGMDEVQKKFNEPLMAYFNKRGMLDELLPLAGLVSDSTSIYNRIARFRAFHTQALVKKARSLNKSYLELERAIRHFKGSGMILKSTKM